VHLVWRAAGLETYERFLESYVRHDAGSGHDLVLLFNGFDDEASLRPYRERAAGLAEREIVLGEPCLDLAAYQHAAATLAHERICVLNSYSELTSAGWLERLEAPLADDGVGACGATGAYGSHLSYELFQLGVPSAYGAAFEGRRSTRELLHELAGARVPGAAEYWLYALLTVVRERRRSTRFPDPHLRTNGLLMDRALFADVCRGSTRSKRDTYGIESGSGSITARLRALGRRPVVVDRHGAAFEVADWHRSDVFRQADQADLLIVDNQTRIYAAANARQRAALSAWSWGPWARPR